jgi:periplasmic protein TonB
MAVTLPGASGASGQAGEPTATGPRLTLGGYGLTASDPAVQGRRAVTLPVSIALHTAAALGLVVGPLLLSEATPEPRSGVRAFLVEPMSVPPPPPPPAARPAAAPRVPPKPQPQAAAFVAPVEVPTEIVPEQALDLGGVESGSPDGVEGGVPGGVVGGIVGGLPQAPPPPVVPVRVGGVVREPRRVVVVQPVYPDVAAKARIQGTVILEATVNERGRVVNVSLLQGAPILTDAALDAVKKWVYTPTLINGVPTPIIMTVTVHFRLS